MVGYDAAAYPTINLVSVLVREDTRPLSPAVRHQPDEAVTRGNDGPTGIALSLDA
jgi:hypothetical protein